MSASPAYLVVTAITSPGKAEQMQNYASQVVPLLIKGGGEPVARYGAIEQLNGEGGPESVAVVKFPSAQAIKDVLSSGDYKALAGLRDEAFSRVDQMICASV